MVNTLLIFEIFCHVLKGREGERKGGRKERNRGLTDQNIYNSLHGLILMLHGFPSGK